MVSKKTAIGITLILVFFLPGCWSRTEVENLAIVTGIGLDTVEKGGQEKFLLTANIIRPALAGSTQGGGGKAGKPVYWRVSSVGDTLADAEGNLNLRIPRRIFYGHLRFVLINEKVARKGLVDVIDYLQRSMRIRPRVLILMTPEKAFDTLGRQSELEPDFARQLDEMDRMALDRSSKAFINDLAQTTAQMIAPGVDPVIAGITPVESPPTEPGGKPVEVFRVNRGGVFHLDKFVGWLDSNETRGYLFGIGKAKSGPVSLMLGEHPHRNVSVMMTRATGKIKVQAHGDKVMAKIEVTAEGDLSEFHMTKEIATDQGLKILEKKFGDAIKLEVLKAINKSKTFKADIFGFGETLHRSDPKGWKRLEKRWYDILPQIKVTLKVNADIRRTGMISEPFKPE